MIISPAYAQGATSAAGGFEAFLPLILIFVVFYFLLIRPQQKKLKAHREMLTALRRGDRVVTGGGIVGQITKVIDDTEVMVEIAENVRVRVMRATIQDVMQKTQPVSGGKDDEADDDEPAKPAEKSGGLKNMLGGKGK